jgi:hypothetical protein
MLWNKNVFFFGSTKVLASNNNQLRISDIYYDIIIISINDTTAIDFCYDNDDEWQIPTRV